MQRIRNPKPLAHFPSAMAQNSTPVNLRQRKGVFRRLFKTMVWLVVLIGLSTGGLLYYLSRGPVSNERLRVEIVSVLSSILGPNLAAEVTEARISFGKSGILSVAAKNVKISEKSGGEPYGQAEQINIGIKLLALLQGEYKVDSILVENSAIDLQRIGLQNSNWSVKWPDALHLEEVMKIPANRLYYLSQSMGLAGLKKVTWRNMKINGLVVSKSMSRDISIREMVVKVQDATGNLSIDATINIGSRDVKLVGSWEKIDDSFALNLNLNGLDSSDILPDAKDSHEGAIGLNAPLKLSYRHPFGPDLKPGQSTLKVEISPGLMRFGYDDIVKFSGGQFNLRMLPEKNQIELEKSTIKFTNSSAVLTGGIRFPLSSNPNAAVSTIGAGGAMIDASNLNNPIFELIANDIIAAPSDSDGPPIAATFKVSGRLNPVERVIEMDEIRLWSEGGNLQGAGSLGFYGETPSLALALTIPEMTITALKQVWPVFIATKARRWVIDHVDGGEVVGGRIDAAIPSGLIGRIRQGKKMLPDQMSVFMNVIGTSVKTIGDLPPIEDASGTMLFQGMETRIKLDKGTIVMENGRVVEATGGELNIGDFRAKPTVADLKLGLSGQAADILAIGAKKPLRVVDVVKINPSDISGKATVDLSVKFPLQAGLTGVDVDWKALLKLSDVTLRKPLVGRKLSRANLTIDARPGIANIKGKVRIDGIPSTINLAQPFGPKLDAPIRREVKLRLDKKALKKLALNLDAVIKGPITVSLASTETAGIDNVKVDLTRASLSLPWINWSKGRGIKAVAEFTMRVHDKGTSISKFSLKGAGFRIAGKFNLDKRGIVDARLSQLSLNKGDNMKVSMTRNRRGYAIVANGSSFDARAVISQIVNAGVPKSELTRGVQVKLVAKVTTLTGFGGETLKDVSLQYDQKNGVLSRAVMTGKTNGSLKTTLSILPNGNTTTTTLISSNAGAALRFLNIYERMDSGYLTVSLKQKGNGPHRGKISIRKFRLKNEPRLKRLLSRKERVVDRESRLLESIASKPEINPNDVKINIATAEIVKSKDSLEIKNGLLRASDVGSNFSGTIYNAAGNINLKGTYLPGYGLNRFASKIPIVSLAFGDGTKRGFLGITYRLSGKARNPKITVNPISVIAPGIFRKVFEFK